MKRRGKEEREGASFLLSFVIGRIEPSVTLGDKEIKSEGQLPLSLHWLTTSSTWSCSWPLQPECRCPLSQGSSSGGIRSIYTFIPSLTHSGDSLPVFKAKKRHKRGNSSSQSVFFTFSILVTLIFHGWGEKHVEPLSMFMLTTELFVISFPKAWGYVFGGNWKVFRGMVRDGFI